LVEDIFLKAACGELGIILKGPSKSGTVIGRLSAQAKINFAMRYPTTTGSKQRGWQMDGS
jgi:hypothetical protein